ncbi:MAG TPA: PQQ-dependent sugar dehydrogenase [Bacteroidota bacterium]|nr:PQQ-dependent sugar dehydrogenase [Bacteroidota bacterium]
MRFILVSLALALLFILASPSSATAQIVLHDEFPNLSFGSPVGLYEPGDGTNRLFVVEQAGRIRAFQNDSLVTSTKMFLDITDSIASGGELGLLGLAFHPQYASNGYFYVDYTRNNPLRTVISRFQVSSNPDSAIRASELVLLEQPQPFDNHNGGQLAFGPDGYLYIGFGDGGSGGDPFGNGQDKSTMLGKILRINVDSAAGGKQYSIPADNPFYNNDSGFVQEIFTVGMRNPWRFSFDKPTSRLWVGDVGQNQWEEIDTAVNGGNYGWNIMEGDHCYNSGSCNQTGLSLPVWEYFHNNGRCSITGGFVYRGSSLPSLYGKYVYGDLCSGEVFTLKLNQLGPPTNELLLNAEMMSSFGVDKFQELYMCAYSEGRIYKFISPSPPEPVSLVSPADGAHGLPNVVECRWTYSVAATKYHLEVATDSAFTSFFLNDSTILDTVRQVGPLANATKYYWRVRALNDNGGSVFTASRSFTTAAYSAAYHVMQGWNLFSLPLEVADSRLSAVLPPAISGAFRYDPVSGYQMTDTLIPGTGYWIKFGDSTTVSIVGDPRGTDTVDVVPGWNLIGVLSGPVAVDSIIQIPSGILLSSFFEYQGAYQKVPVLSPSKGYWVRAGGAGQIILQTASPGMLPRARLAGFPKR